MSWQMPQRYAGSPTSATPLIGATAPPPTRNNATNQFSCCPYLFCLCDRVDNERLQHYSGPSTSESSLAGAIEPPQVPNNATLHLYGLVSLEGNQRPQHYASLSTGVSTLAGAIGPLQTATNATVRNQNQVIISCHSLACLYIQNGNACGESITCDTVPKHFRAMHGVKRINRKVKIVCRWQNCGRRIRRHNFVPSSGA
ncbi:hypothetical protein EDC04DRAFT_717271 [Pisolithus marmoratus]|nr:hypothetical protein EDC04DRAFT_717271 [Pisolithus marmoratus]